MIATAEAGVAGISLSQELRKDFRQARRVPSPFFLSDCGERQVPYFLDREVSLAMHSTGTYIKHFQYGCGVITESGDDRTTIDFDAHGIKKFVTSLMVIEPAEGTPPKRRRVKRVKPVKPAPTLSGPVFVPGAK